MKKQNLKKGDMLLCKKTLHKCQETLTSGHKYKILTIDESSDCCDYYCISDNYLKFEVFFESSTHVHGYFIYDYFYTKQEVRKMKLTQIYEETES